MQRRFQALVFDMDGTLFDTMGVLNRLAQTVMHKHYGLAPQFASELYQKTSGLPFRYQLEAIFPEHTLNNSAAEEFENTKKEIYQQPVTPFADVFEHLPLWRSWGYKIAVSSNDEEANVKTKIGPHLAQFDLLLGHRPGFLKGKPHFDALQQRYQLLPEQILFVGDSLHDAKMAHANGITFVGRVGTFAKEDFLNLGFAVHLVRNFHELHGLLQHQLA